MTAAFDHSPSDWTGKFLAAIWGGGPHSVCWMDPERAFTFAIVDDPGAVERHLPDLQGVDVWISAHPLKGTPIRGRGDRDDIAHIVAIPADLDWQHPTRRTDQPLPTEEEVRDGLDHLGPELQPSIVVHSGHGLQPWWLLTSPVTPDEAEGLIEQLGVALAQVGLENGRADLPSILRLPGTRNHKGEPVPVTVEWMDSTRRFTPEFLRKRLPTWTGMGTTHKGGTRHRGGSVTHDQQALTNYVVTSHKAHSPDVWRDGSIHLVRPGKPARDGSSASVIVGEDGDALLTVFTDHWPDLPPGSYVLGVDGQLHHPGDPSAQVTINLTQTQVVDYQPDSATIFIDWHAFAERDEVPRTWLVEGFWPWGRALALWADAKAGKSELALWCSCCLALGRHPWTGSPIDPVDVAYFDWEMTADDLEDRLASFGINHRKLTRLHYALHPPIHQLDIEAGGAELTNLVLGVGAKAVIIDTFGRAVTGDENEADTVRAFYRHTGIRLKAEGIGYLRTDHSGKDRTKGQRGSSAKRDDVDIVWSQKRTTAGVRLDCSGYSRLSWVEPILDLDRSDINGLVGYSAQVRMSWPDGTIEKAKELNRLGLPLDISRRKAREALDNAGVVAGKNELLSAALRYRNLPSPANPATPHDPTLESGDHSGDHSDLFTDPLPGDHLGTTFNNDL